MPDTTSLLSKFLYTYLPKFFADATGGPSGVLYASATEASMGADTNETTLCTYTLPANTLSANGKAVRVTAWLSAAANGNTKTVRLKFGSTTIATAAGAGNNVPIYLCATVVRSSASAQKAVTERHFVNVGDTIQAATPTDDTTAAITIAVTGQNGTASAGDIVFNAMLVETLN